MENKVFRSKSIERISSPEQLNDYVRVSNPGVWMVLTAIIVLLIGVCVWGIIGKMETAVPAAVSVNNGHAVCYVKEDLIDKIKVGQTVCAGDAEYTVEEIEQVPVAVSDDTDAYVLHVGGLSVGEWVYEVKLSADAMTDGIYAGKIVIESVRPVSFLVN